MTRQFPDDKDVKICAACKRSSLDLFSVQSLLDFKMRQVCGECVDNQAEPHDVAKPMGNRIRQLVPEIAEAVRVYHGRKYIKLSEWQTGSSAASLDLEDDDALSLAQQIVAMKAKLDNPEF
ncbi:MAG: hypothetical protein ACR2RF_16750 [Geminicoccaceae bacterium]